MTTDDTLDAEWDDATLAELKDDGPHTISELVLVPGYTQSEWDREQVRKLKLIDAAAADMRASQHVKPPEALIYDALLKLECYKMAALIYPAVSGLDELPHRHRDRGAGGRFIAAGGT